MHPKSDSATDELKTLRRRLTEAEDTLHAIRAGEVDAVVVYGPAGQQIYTLESPDQPFRVFVEQMQEGALTLNSEGTIIYCNHFFADLVGRPLGQVRGQPIHGFIANDLEGFRELFAKAASGVVHGESWLHGRDGNTVPVQLALNALPPQDARMFGMVVTDLSERERAKRLEAERLAAEEASAARDQFLAVVSHELRTPLNAILGWTQILRQEDQPSPMKQGLEVIERSAWTQAQLIDDLLDVSRVLAGKLRLELATVDLAQVVQASLSNIEPNARAKKIHIDLKLPQGELLVRGDVDRLQQIVGNLLSNAVKFTSEQGRICVSLREQEGEAQIEVSDNGIGIPADYLPRLFELYQQVEGSTTRRNSGLGLGLAIVKQLTELHGGQVSAESGGEGEGATFRLHLPLLQAGEAQLGDTSPSCISKVALPNITILLVEDDEATRELLTRVLSAVQAQVVSVANASDAIARIEQERIDVLVSDIGLPGMDGYELISKIRSGGRAGRELPAIALTAFASREDRRKALVAGFQVHLPKPVDHDELCAVIANLAGVLHK